MNEMNPFETSRQISGGYCLARAVHVLAELNVADALGETAPSATQLAGAVGADVDALSRILRLASAHGVFEQRADTYQHSPASRMLRTDHPRSMRAFVRMFGLAINWDTYRELEYSVKTGRRAMEKLCRKESGVTSEGIPKQTASLTRRCWRKRRDRSRQLFNAVISRDLK
jgi:hypothetical protein